MSDTGLRVAAWLLTYALHSTVLLCAAALLTARWVRGEAWRETLWKTALLGGIVTATLQSAGWMGGAGRGELFVLRAAPSPAASTAPSTAPALRSAAAPEADPRSGTSAIEDATRSRTTAPALRTTTEVSRPAAPSPPAPADPTPSSRPPLVWALLAWAVGAGLMLARLAWRQVRLRRLLHGRAAVADGAVLGMLAELRRNAALWRPVRLTACPASPTPLVLGGGEICVPPRFLDDLDPEQQRSALAHELAHLARRDPAWHFAVSVLEAVFFFQPLNRMGRARLRESAEFLCDAWAARQTGSPLGLARCLAEVASWVAPGRHPIPAGTLAMAEGGSPVVQRVQRLTAWRGEPREGSGIPRMAAAALLIAAVAAVAPAVASTDGARRQPAAGGTVLPARTMGADTQEIVLVRHPDPSQPLAARWAWALEQMGTREMGRAWIAYSIPTRLAPAQGWWTEAGGLELSSIDGAPLNARLGVPNDHAVLFFSVARNGELERVSGRRGVGMDVGGLPVLWLGAAGSAESFAQLRRLADGLRDPGQREGLVSMIGIHPDDGVVPYLAAVLGRDGSNGVRREAAGALGMHPTDESLLALRTAVQRDGSDDVRREAVEAAAAHGTPDAADLLRALATGSANAAVRRTAAEELGRHPDASGLETLAAVARGDGDPRVAREAVEAMQRFAPAQSAPVLARIAWTHPNPSVARQAAESLGKLPAAWSVARLDSIARAHPQPDVARQAVEALAEFPDAVTGAYLRRIARTHPDRRVREEAVEQLSRGGDPRPEAGADAPAEAGAAAGAEADAALGLAARAEAEADEVLPARRPIRNGMDPNPAVAVDAGNPQLRVDAGDPALALDGGNPAFDIRVPAASSSSAPATATARAAGTRRP